MILLNVIIQRYIGSKMSWFLMNRKGEEEKRKREIRKLFMKVNICTCETNLMTRMTGR